MNILYTCNEYPPYPFGGLGTFVKEMSETLVREGHKVFVFGYYNEIDEAIIENINNVVVYREPYPFTENSFINILKNRILYAKRITDICINETVNIVEAHDTAAWFLFLKYGFTVRLHNGERYFKKRGFLMTFLERTAFLVRRTTLISVSNYNLRLFKKYFKLINPFSKIKVVQNGISNKPIDKIIEKNKEIVFAGTLKPIKGLDLLINAFLLSEKHVENYTLNIYGKDTVFNGESYWEYLLKSVTGLRDYVNQGRIKYHGVVDKHEVLVAFSHSTLCVFPSRYESFGLVVIEAMSMGSIVLYSNQGAAEELINEGINGFLFKNNDANDLQKKINYILSLSEENKNQIAEEAIKTAKKFSMKKCAFESLIIYNDTKKR